MIKRREKYYLGQLGPFIAMYDENDRWVETIALNNIANDPRITRPVLVYGFNKLTMSNMFLGYLGAAAPTRK